MRSIILKIDKFVFGMTHIDIKLKIECYEVF